MISSQSDPTCSSSSDLALCILSTRRGLSVTHLYHTCSKLRLLSSGQSLHVSSTPATKTGAPGIVLDLRWMPGELNLRADDLKLKHFRPDLRSNMFGGYALDSFA